MGQARSPSPTSTDVFATEQSKISTTKRPRKQNKRPSKRFLWQEDLHLRFVAAIFDLGLKNASPKLLLPLMNKSDPDSGLTTEHLKSHLQKYRVNYERSRREFQMICNNEIKRDRKRHRREERRSNTFVFPVQGRNNSTTSRNSPDSGPGHENESSANIAVVAHQMRSTISSSEQDDITASVAARCYPVNYLPMQQMPITVPDSSNMPELTDAQWQTFSMLMSGPPAHKGGFEALSIQVPQEVHAGEAQVQAELHQMHQSMQAQMNFHRQMLTRKMELSGCLYSRSDLRDWKGREYSDCYRASVLKPEPSTFQQAWTSTQQIHQRQLASRLQQKQQFETMEGSQHHLQTLPDVSGSVPQTLPCDSLPTLIDDPFEEQVESKSDGIGEDLHRWDPFDAGLEDNELFDFLKA